ncbi:MAG: hypothetical protein V4574_15450 [Pseudomonadota bacterium]
MPAWRLAIATATPPATPLDAARRFAVRQRAALGALGALLLTLALGWAAPVPPPAGWTIGGLAGVLGLGILAWHVARLTAMPVAEPLAAALAAALTAAALLPALAPQALLVPAILSLWAGWQRNDQRVVALLVQCGVLATLGANSVNHIGFTFVPVTILGFAAFLALKRSSGAANDNPSMERHSNHFGADGKSMLC